MTAKLNTLLGKFAKSASAVDLGQSFDLAHGPVENSIFRAPAEEKKTDRTLGMKSEM